VLVYKILLPSEWERFNSAGTFDGSPLDRESGFIHCSGADQVAATVRRVFGDRAELVVVAVDADELGDAVRWEAAPDGGTFPHVYAPLPLGAVVSVHHVDGAAAVDEILPRG
jgi:uncharacterized protein (DUF952 family)